MTWESPGYKSQHCVAVETRDSSSIGYWETVVPVKPETTYTISFYYKTRTDGPHATSGDTLYNQGRPGGPNLELGMAPDDPSEAGKPTAWSDVGIALPPLGGIFLPVATDWSLFRHTFITRLRQTKLLVKFRLRCYAQKAWMDEISVVEGAIPVSIRQRDVLWTSRDTTPPAVFLPKPSPNSNAKPSARISATFKERGTGIDLASAKIELDGKNVTAQASVGAGGFVLIPAEPLSPGAHRVKVRIADRAGNEGNVLTWQFGVGTTLNNVLEVARGQTRLNGEAFFPIGIYAYACHPDDGRFRNDHLSQTAAAGYNIVLNTIEKRQGLDRELAHGVMGTLNITRELKHCIDPTAAKVNLFEKGQGRFSDHPCVVAYWADDPENVENTQATPMSQTAIDKLRCASSALKQHRPGTPSVFAISNLPRLRAAMPYGDILLSYRYAVPHMHPMMVYGWTIAVCQNTVPDKSLWFLSQAIDLGYGVNFKLPDFRPTPQEMRAMAFFSLVCGVQGYCMYANHINAQDYPEHWAALLDIATRIRQIAPALASGKSAQTVHLKDERHAGSIFYREMVHEDTHTLIAVNMSAGTIAATWQFSRPIEASLLFEDRVMGNASKTVCNVFEPWSVHILQWHSGIRLPKEP